MPIPIKFGTKEISKKVGEGEKEKEVKETVDDIVNNPNPWTWYWRTCFGFSTRPI